MPNIFLIMMHKQINEVRTDVSGNDSGSSTGKNKNFDLNFTLIQN